MSGFDPRKYHGRPLDEVLGNVNGEVRRALQEAHAVCRLCLRQKNLPAHREGHVRMRLWQVEQPAAGPRPPALLRPEDFALLFELPGTEFVSFQVGPRVRGICAPAGAVWSTGAGRPRGYGRTRSWRWISSSPSTRSGPLGRRARSTCLDAAGVRPRHALDAWAGRQAPVPYDALVSAAGAERVGQRLSQGAR